METNIRSLRTASLVAIGERLKKAREAKSLKIDQVQKKTRIHATVLLALEEGACESLMSATYAKSFLKSYAAYLGLDTEEIMKEYSAARPAPQQYAASSQLNIPQPSSAEAPRRDFLLKVIYIASAAVLIAVMLFFANAVWKKASSIFRKKAGSARVAAVKPSKAPTRATPPKAVRKTEKAGAFTSIYIPKKDPIKVSLRIKQPVRIEVKKDGILLFDRVMSKDTVKTFTADTKLNLYIAKAEAIEMTVNGRSFGSPGRGVIKDLEITRSGIRIK
jgi:cytoskeletal protein RodZ